MEKFILENTGAKVFELRNGDFKSISQSLIVIIIIIIILERRYKKRSKDV